MISGQPRAKSNDNAFMSPSISRASAPIRKVEDLRPEPRPAALAEPAHYAYGLQWQFGERIKREQA